MLAFVLLCHQCGVALREGDRFCPACGTPAGDSGANKDALVGRVIGGAYVIQELVGVGGMGRVYQAEQRMLGRTVAIKVIHPHLLSDEQSVARFYTEARAASRLNHPNSVSIIDFGRTDDGILYLVMEYLQGKDLSRLMREDGPLPLGRIVDIVVAVLAALGEAHALGVVHRDLKPENVIIERLRSGADLVKVVDFGLAKLLSGAQSATNITLPGLVCGTPDYMSPEQGRGDDVDARGDLYSVGVMLFELLTEQLPYIADTPTNVVLRHIQDPIPDPRRVAPQRNIPPNLAEVTMRALAKSPRDRYQSAEELAGALSRLGASLRPQASERTCTVCGAPSPASKRFCAECGAPLLTSSPSAPRVSMPPGMTTSVAERGLFVGREPELSHLELARQRAREGLVPVCLSGEAGVGKTRLLAEVAERWLGDGDLVVAAGPHPTGALVPYHAVGTLVSVLLETELSELGNKADELRDDEPLVAAGFEELADPRGMRGAPGESRAGAVARALGWAVHAALEAAGKPRLVLIVDDLHLCDGLTAQALAGFASHYSRLPVLLLTAQAAPRSGLMPGDAEQLMLRGLGMEEARALVSGVMVPGAEPHPDDKLYLPLYLEQLQGLGLAIDGVQHTLPTRLADAVTRRLERLDVEARRVLQAVAILGNATSRTLLERVCGGESNLQAVRALCARGLLVDNGAELEVIHPFVRDLVEASTPAQARKELHGRALGALPAEDTPLEVRAHHAFGAGESMTALMLLERMGDLAHARGDAGTAMWAFQRGLMLARRELLESGDTSLDDAISSFSRRLGSAMAGRGDMTGAEGVFREALEFAGPASLSRAHILLGLGEVVALRKRYRDAYRLLGQALDLSVQLEHDALQADVQLAIGKLRRAEGNRSGAVASLRTALDLLEQARQQPLKRATVAVELAGALLDAEEPGQALLALDEAERWAEQAQAPYLMSRTALMRGTLAEQRADQADADTAFAECLRLALLAGDADVDGRLSRVRAGGPEARAVASGLSG